MLVDAGNAMATKPTWRTKLPLTIIGAVLGVLVFAGTGTEAPLWPAGASLLAHVVGASVQPVALVIGAIAGWLSLRIVGICVALTAALAALGVALAIVAAVLVGLYLLIAAFAGWKPFAPTSAPVSNPSVAQPVPAD
jgi:hypothetical protein